MRTSFVHNSALCLLVWGVTRLQISARADVPEPLPEARLYDPGWEQLHQAYSQAAAEASFDIVVYGDSIVEALGNGCMPTYLSVHVACVLHVAFIGRAWMSGLVGCLCVHVMRCKLPAAHVLHDARPMHVA